MIIRRNSAAPIGRKAKDVLVDSFQGLNTTAPYTQLKNGVSPYYYNVRLYARNSTDRRVAVGTRKGPGFYSVPLGETLDQSVGDNLVANPGFETDTTGWTTAGVGASIARDTSQFYAGVASLKLTTAASGNQQATYNLTGLVVGVSYIATARVKASAAAKDVYCQTGFSGYAGFANVSSTGDWDLITLTSTATATSGTVEFGVFSNSDFIYIDEVTVTAVTSDQTITETTWVGKKFTAGVSGRLSKVEVNIKQGTTPTQHLMVAIYSDSSGDPGTLLGTSSILLGDTTTSYAYETARFIEAPVVASGTSYWIVCYQQDGGSGNWMWATQTSATTAKTSNNSGGTWNATSFDLNAKTYISTSSKFLGGVRYTPSSGTNKTVIAHGTSIYSVDDLTGATTVIETGLSASATDYYFDQADDKLFYTNGYDAPRFWNATTVIPLSSYMNTGKFAAFHKNRFFVVDPTDPTKIKFTDLGDYESSQSTNFIYAPSPKSGDPITGLKVFQDNLVVFTRKTKYVLYGDDPGNFVLRQSSGQRGAVNQHVIQSDPNYIYYLSDDGVYRYNGSADELMSDSIQTEIDSMNDKTKASAVVHNNYYRLYYPSATSAVANSAILWDTLNNFWLRDSGTYIYRPFATEDGTLIEGSSLVGQLFYAEQQYSDMGKPIDFVYWTKYFGDGLHKILLRRLLPSIRLQTQPYDLDVMIDIDQRNTTPISYTVSAQASGSTWGSGETWGGGETWGSATVSSPTVMQGTEAFWHQIRFEHSGVDTPVELLSYMLQIRVRRTE